MKWKELSPPPFFDPEKVGDVWKVDYEKTAAEAERWREKHELRPVARDRERVLLLLVDVQNTFCTPGFELFVAGRSGNAAVEDNRRLCAFIYRNLHRLTRICLTMDTHQAMQVFHSVFLVDENGKHPPPFTIVTAEDVEKGVWRFNEKIGDAIGVEPSRRKEYLLHYTGKLSETGKYDLTVWPYHAMFGGIGHSLVSSVEEAVFFHGIARCGRPDFQIKGQNPLTEKYSVLSPEVLTGPGGEKIGEKNEGLIKTILDHDAVIVAGQAKSHCVAWTLADLLAEIDARGDRKAAEKIYLLEDCTSPVVIPGVVDYTRQADDALKRFVDAGMRVVRSTDPVDAWPGFEDLG